MLPRVRDALLLFGLCGPLYAETLDVGMPAPDFRLPDGNGEQRTLGDFAGKWLVLYFYPKDDTPGCTTEACSFRDELTLIHKLDAQVVGISTDDTESHRAFAKKYSLPFPLLADTEGEVAGRYGVRRGLLGFLYASRQTFLIDPEGVIRHVWRDVKPAEHTQEVIAMLRDVQ